MSNVDLFNQIINQSQRMCINDLTINSKEVETITKGLENLKIKY